MPPLLAKSKDLYPPSKLKGMISIYLLLAKMKDLYSPAPSWKELPLSLRS